MYDIGVCNSINTFWVFLSKAYSNVGFGGKSINTLFVSFSLLYETRREKDRRIKGKTMAQWINLLQYNSFVNT